MLRVPARAVAVRAAQVSESAGQPPARLQEVAGNEALGASTARMSPGNASFCSWVLTAGSLRGRKLCGCSLKAQGTRAECGQVAGVRAGHGQELDSSWHPQCPGRCRLAASLSLPLFSPWPDPSAVLEPIQRPEGEEVVVAGAELSGEGPPWSPPQVESKAVVPRPGAAELQVCSRPQLGPPSPLHSSF